MSPVGETALALAASVAAGERTASEVVAGHLERIHEVNPVLNAFRVVRDDEALAEAAELDARDDLAGLPLAGVPVAIKDNVPVVGQVMTDGSTALPSVPQEHDHEIVRRLRAAGAVVVGITTCPELCLWGATDGDAGLTRNPWNLSWTPGGSSGGSAAAVAAGMVPLGHANDGLGSIRIPAADCGLFGIKPGRGVVPADVGTSSWFGMSENGPVATTVADAAGMLAVLAGQPRFADVAEPGALRIGVSLTSPLLTAPVSAAWKRAALDTADLLAAAGHTVVEAGLSYPARSALAVTARWFAGAADDAVDLPEDRLEPRTRRHAAIGRVVRRLGLVRESDRHAFREHATKAFGRFDVLLTPTLAQDPIEAAMWSRRSWLANVNANTRYAPFCAPWNLAGFPAAAVPVPSPGGAPPRSVQLVAPDGGERRLLALAAQLEHLRPWSRHAPLPAPVAQLA
jgi:amidase